MAFEIPVDPRQQRRARLVGWVTTILLVVIVAFLAYMAYAAVTGSEQLVYPADSRVCRLPSALGWEYEAINYDQATDAELAAAPDPLNCESVGQPAGTELEATDGTRLAGWYIPAAGPIGPQGPTVVLVHGHGSNKNTTLKWAELLHPSYNLVLFDQRNSGQSFGTETTLGAREQWDLQAVVGWLRETHAPTAIGVLANSMGGMTATAAVASGMPVEALILDSTPADAAGPIARRIEAAGYPLPVPASWAILLGALFRTGVDITSADPVSAIDQLGAVPVLILQGDADATIPLDSAERIAAEAESAGVSVELHMCLGAGHSTLIETCPDDYRDWVLGFLARHLTP